MAARCASCCYPLSVSDSVSCCECMSYFHIDCAQLVGFPYYELSSDPIRNTFHCQTCKILPLPRHCVTFSDSDSDDECVMPSRQMDYHLEGQPDFAKDMNEIKGTVQDLSELCKDMFREISELKSINLTLRCCVENLRHDGEQRDGIISELKRRIEALEGKGTVNMFKPIGTTDMYVDRINVEKEEDAERYLTPDPEYSRLKEMEIIGQESFKQDEILPSEDEKKFIQPSLESETPATENNRKRTLQTFEPPETAIEIPETSDFDEENSHERNDKKVYFAEEEIISTTVEGNNSETSVVTSVNDWDWKGNEAVQLNENKDYSSAGEDESEEEENENEITEIEDTEAQDWEILDEVVKPEFITKHHEDEASETVKNIERSEEEAEESRVNWADEVNKYDEEEGRVESNEEPEETTLKLDTKCLTANLEPRVQSRPTFEEEETEATNEEVTEGADATSLKDEHPLEDGEVENPKVEELVMEIAEGAEVEGRVDAAEGSRLEGEPRLESDPVAEGAAPQGEGEGGQSPEGEVQPSELSEGAEPPPPQPQHTPDDLWDYLKETVTGEHPATVEEFVQKLIGTLEHVPEEYLKPVIDYNIKRATSPSVTDGEHIEAKEGDQHLQGEDHGTDEISGEARPQDSDEVASGGDTTTLSGGGASPPEGDGSSAEPAALHEDMTVAEQPSESVEGYSALEAAS